MTTSAAEELAAINRELLQIEVELRKLHQRKGELAAKRDVLNDSLLLEQSKELAKQDWIIQEFPWSKQVDQLLRDVFKLSLMRPNQLPTINATLSKRDAILIMPTGGGKSLTFQLPALVDKGITLVVSPLISLMEDQVMALTKLSINAGMLHAECEKMVANHLIQALVDKSDNVKMIYVTPERLAKSKRFMSKLQKCYELGRLARIAIDEVHCCSQWGHDFRPDYKFLGVLKPMFPDVPILGLTATATSKVTVDVQKMLNIQGCIVLKASFNRPNLFYEVRKKPQKQQECVDELAGLLESRFADQSGIIYTTSIKECEELKEQLKLRGLRVSCYHASMDVGLRSRVHGRWLRGELQAVVATIAFGLGIDKPNVRFVIHHALSKSMENFYQESGRAGRDGARADCIMYYRLADVFRLSTMVFTQQTGLHNLYAIVDYCLDAHRCRRSMIAAHFDEAWESADCARMCDHCARPCAPRHVDITKHCRSIYLLLARAASLDTKLTAQKLVDAWFGKGVANLRSPDIGCPKFGREVGEAILAHLLTKGYLKEDFHYTPYNTISYIRRGLLATEAEQPNHHVTMVQGHLLPESSTRSPGPVNGSTCEKSEAIAANKDSGGGKGRTEQAKRRVIVKAASDSDADVIIVNSEGSLKRKMSEAGKRESKPVAKKNTNIYFIDTDSESC